MIKTLDIIINPAAGQMEPILSYINQAFKDTDIDWNIYITKKANDAKDFAQNAINKKIDAVAVYGGDGTVMEVAQILCDTNTPLAIIPGGTANVCAKELNIPTSQPALELLTKPENYEIKKIDVASCNDQTFMIRINAGALADMVRYTPRKAKDTWGMFAYILTALRRLNKSKKATYTIDIDNKEIKTEGVSLVVANIGNIGIPNLSFTNNINVSDGLLDIVIIESVGFRTIFNWIQHIITKTPPKKSIEHFTGKIIQLTIEPKQNIILDDVPISTQNLKIQIHPNALSVIIPKII